MLALNGVECFARLQGLDTAFGLIRPLSANLAPVGEGHATPCGLSVPRGAVWPVPGTTARRSCLPAGAGLDRDALS